MLALNHLTTIAHAFNYRVTVLRDGVKSAARVGRSLRVAERILEDIGIPWGHQVAVMFQIVCALALEVPSVLRDIESLHGVSPNASLSCELFGHADHNGRDCECLSSDSTGAYVLEFLEWIGVPGSASMLEMGPGMWLHSLSRDQAMDAALQLHRDVCLITTNLDVLDQYVLCLQGTASKILELGLEPWGFLLRRWLLVPWGPGPPSFCTDGGNGTVAALAGSGTPSVRYPRIYDTISDYCCGRILGCGRAGHPDF